MARSSSPQGDCFSLAMMWLRIPSANPNGRYRPFHALTSEGRLHFDHKFKVRMYSIIKLMWILWRTNSFLIPLLMSTKSSIWALERWSFLTRSNKSTTDLLLSSPQRSYIPVVIVGFEFF
jgi:hypothetical protein